jgi:acyl-CoA dehydrogenase
LNFDYSEKVRRLRARFEAFMNELVYPNEKTHQEQLEAAENR